MSIKEEPMNKICCELAYTGTLFWLPLLACPRDKNAKYCANQGLWILILSVLSCWLIQILGAVKGMLNGGLFGILAGGIYSLFFIGNVIRHVAKSLSIPILVTENGIGTDDDTRRMEYIRRAVAGVKSCVEEGIPVLGYLHWSLLDNFEWQEDYAKTFGLIAVDRATQKRKPKESLKYLGEMKKEFTD